MNISINLLKSENEFIASCPELEINCYGKNKIEAVRRIKNVLQFYMHSAKELGLDIENIESFTIDGQIAKLNQENNIVNIPHAIN
jgi:predicted RNase H-like HicB family nuclease